MDDKRKLEIAMKLLKSVIKKNGIKLNNLREEMILQSNALQKNFMNFTILFFVKFLKKS